MNDKRVIEELSRKRAQQEEDTRDAASKMKEQLAADIKLNRRKFLEECMQEINNPSKLNPILKSALSGNNGGIYGGLAEDTDYDSER